MKQKHIFWLFGFIMWPIIIATPLIVNTYVKKLTFSEIEYGQIPQAELALGVTSGIFSAIFFLGLSYLITYIVSKFKKNSKITGSKVFFVITILFTSLFVFSYGGKVVEVIQFDKDKVEEIQKRINEYKDSR
mgnify:CR=1 FL=1